MDELSRAQYAKEALENPLISEALTTYEQDITELWKQSRTKDADAREKLWMMLQAAHHFRSYLQATIDSGKITAAKLKQETLWQKLREKI